MNKKLVSMCMTGIVAATLFTVGASTEVEARKTKPETSTDITIQREPGESVVMSVSAIGTIFQNRYPNAAIHSIELNSDKLSYVYKVVGYSKYHEYKMNIDIVTGYQSGISEGGKPKKIIGEIFNKDKVIDVSQAEAIAKRQLGDDAVMKGWKIEATNGQVNYYVTMHQNGKKMVVALNAETGEYISTGKAKKLPPEPDQGFDRRRTNIIWGSDVEMDRK